MIHHSATPDGNTFSWAAIRRYHINTYKWADIGYHFGIERLGSEYEALIGRPLDRIGAHCPQSNMNQHAIAICIVGNFDIIRPSAGALTVLSDRLLRPLMRNHNIPPANIVFHRDFNPAKTCPGYQFTHELLAPYIPGAIV